MLNLLAQGIWSADRIFITLCESSRPIIPEIENIVARTWEEQKGRLGNALFDGPMSRLESFEVDGADLRLQLSTTSYRVFLGTNLCHGELAERFGAGALANAIGMSGALITSDGRLVMGLRNDRVAYYPNRIHPFAGALEPGDVPGIFNGMRRELAEELNLDFGEVTDLRMIAIIEDCRLHQPEFVFMAQTPRTMGELRESLDMAEHCELWACEASAAAIGGVLGSVDAQGNCKGNQFTPVAVGTLLMYGRYAFGFDWFENICKTNQQILGLGR